MNSGQSLFISREQLVRFTDGLNEGCLKRDGWQSFLARTIGWKGLPFTQIEGIVWQIGSWVEIRSFTFWHIMFLILVRNLKWWSWVDINSWIYWSGVQEKVGSAGEKSEALLAYSTEVTELDKVIKDISVELLKRGAHREEWRRPVISGNQALLREKWGKPVEKESLIHCVECHWVCVL